MNLKYAGDAVNDLARLRCFISEKNPVAAARIAKGLVEGIENLKQFPNLGIRVENAPDPDITRDLYILNYQVRYLVLQETIYILRIWHQKEIK